ncbi:YciI family protein [Gimesia panareensis]|uniref:YciI family protein n=1 Tax=Gimesia panareensis TaxID=2527978 RepID=UPI001189E771|nr:YciI family protein [Gimesia panareensis]QDU49078.1 YCII-related domain protein [Gimesia panareensis]
MKYLLLVYATPDAWEPEERKVALGESVALCHDLHSQTQYCSAAPLEPVETAISVRVREGEALVTDGPFAETTEHLGGYFLVDVDCIEAAVEIAKRIPGARKGTVEVRPVVEVPNLPGGISS